VRLADLVFLIRLLVAKLAVQIKSYIEPEDSSSLYKKEALKSIFSQTKS